MRKGCWDRDERVKDLTLNYTDGSLPFPTFPRFCGQTFYEAKDKELALACVKANNDWMVEEWCEPSGGVNIPTLHHSPLGRRIGGGRDHAQRRARGASYRIQRDPNPPQVAQHQHQLLGPLWQVCNDYGVTVCMHVGSSSSNPIASPDSNRAVG